MQNTSELRRVLWLVLGGSRGGENRARIINELSVRPCNMNQLASKLNVDYRTIMHHVDILKKNSLVVSRGEHYGVTYFLSPWLEANMDVFREICGKLGFRL